MIRWDGTAEAADWLTSRFGEAATFTGDGDDQTLLMWGSWEIPIGTFIADQWGSFNYVPADQLNTWQLAAPLIEFPGSEPTPEPEPEPEPTPEPGPVEEPGGPTGDDFVEETGDVNPPSAPDPETPPEPETEPEAGR